MTNVVAIDSPVWIDTFKAGGFAGLNAITAGADRVFVPPELRLESPPNMRPEYDDWVTNLENSGSIIRLSDGEIQPEDRAAYNPTGKNDHKNGERVDIAIRKFLDEESGDFTIEVMALLHKSLFEGIHCVNPG